MAKDEKVEWRRIKWFDKEDIEFKYEKYDPEN